MPRILKASVFFLLLPLFSLAQSHTRKLTYDIPIEELSKINIISETENCHITHDYDITLEDLSKLDVVKEIKVEKKVNLTYELTLEELMHMEIHLVRNEVAPTYDMPLQGLLKLDVKKEYQIVDKLEIAYDLSIDGLMKLTISSKN